MLGQLMHPPHISARTASYGEVLFHEQYANWLEPRGYLSPEGPSDGDAQRSIFFASARRQNAMRHDGPDGRTLFDKRFLGTTSWAALRRRWATGTFGPPTLSEWNALQWAHRAGILVPEALACGEQRQRGGRRDGWLLTFQLPGLPLDSDDFESAMALRLQSQSIPRKALEYSLAAAVGGAIANLHGAQISFPSCFAKHIYCDLSDPSFNIGFIDLADARTGRYLKLRERARDLASLCATLPLHRFSWCFRKALLRSYLCTAKLEDKWPITRAWHDIGLRVERMASRRRFRENLTPYSRGDLVVPKAGIFIIAKEQEALERISSDFGLDLPETWSAHEPLLCFRGPHEEARRLFEIARTLMAVDVNAPRAMVLIKGTESSTRSAPSTAVFRNPGHGASPYPPDPKDPSIEIIRQSLDRVGLGLTQDLVNALRVLPEQGLYLFDLKRLQRPRKLQRASRFGPRPSVRPR